MTSYLFTSESVTEGHPDKLCDRIADTILDAILSEDPGARVACEVAVKTGIVFLFGEISTEARIDYESLVRETVRNTGYRDPALGFDGDSCGVINCLSAQSPDIALGVDEREGKETGAGDQGMMFGYACDETPDFMPLPVTLAHGLARELAIKRKEEILPFLRPDGKSQVTIEYDRTSGKPKRVHTVVVSAQHSADTPLQVIRKEIIETIIRPVLGEWMDQETTIYVNPTGRFVVGGPRGDSGLTGRKIIVDTYGGSAPHGGGSFSGKDPTKVDRSASYMARHIAKTVVGAGVARRCQVQLSYAIGVSHPLSLRVETFGTGRQSDATIEKAVQELFDLSPGGIIRTLDLRRPLYAGLSAYGHFGENALESPWESLHRTADLKKTLGQR